MVFSNIHRVMRRTRRMAPLRALRASVQNFPLGSGHAELGEKSGVRPPDTGGHRAQALLLQIAMCAPCRERLT